MKKSWKSFLRVGLAFSLGVNVKRLLDKRGMYRRNACAPIRLAMNGDAPKPKSRLCAEQCGFNLHAATRVHGHDKQVREHICRYILRPPFANHRLHTLPDGKVQLDFKRPELYA